MATKRIRSTVPRGTGERVKIDPKEIPEFVAAVKKAGRAQLGLSERAFDYWIAGELPKAVRILLDNPDVTAALWREAERRKLRESIDRK
jgi:hypothetical protein